MLRRFRALLSSLALVPLASGRGVCYDPNHHAQPNADTIRSDLAKIKEHGFTVVRVYTAKYGDENMGSLITSQGLNASLTIPFTSVDRMGKIGGDIQFAIDAAKMTNAANTMARVTQIYVGNENLATANSVPREMTDLIQHIKGAVPSDVLVGTVQRNTEFLDPARMDAVAGFKELLAMCTIIGVNMHPVFTPNTPPEKGMAVVKAQSDQLHDGERQRRFPGMADKIAITEIGWPTGISPGHEGNSLNPCSREGGQVFYEAFNAWRQEKIQDPERSFYFQMFDQPKRVTHGAYEAHFGILDESGEKKFASYSFQDIKA